MQVDVQCRFISWKKPAVREQQGAVLLVLLLFTVTAASAVLVTALNHRTRGFDGASSSNVLKIAQQALIGYALGNADLTTAIPPGHLPCPDNNGDGISNVPCGNRDESAIGRLPWKTLGLSPLRDDSGECLWYAVSGRYKESPSGNLFADADGQFVIFDSNLHRVNGVNNSDKAIAVVFVPGTTLGNQNRSTSAVSKTECGSQRISDGSSKSNNYLERLSGIDNATGSYSGVVALGGNFNSIPSISDSAFILSGSYSALGPVDFNDILAWISPNDFGPVYRQMQNFVGQHVRQCLQSFAATNGSKYPWPAILDSSSLPDYSDDSGERFGRVASDLSNTQASGLNNFWPFDPIQPSVTCFNWIWWDNWKEQIFYAVDKNSAPTLASGGLLEVDSTNTPIAVIVAGRKTTSQARNSQAEKAAIENYLELGNIPSNGNGRIPAGDESFESINFGNNPFNDYVCTATHCS